MGRRGGGRYTGSMRHLVLLLAASALGGCSSILDLPTQSAGANDPPESLYRQLVIAGGVPNILRKGEPAAPVAISGLRKSVPPQPGNWMTCVRASLSSGPRYAAVFFRNRTIIELRSGIAIDRCENEEYAALQTVSEINEMAAQRGGTTRPVESSRRNLPGIY